MNKNELIALLDKLTAEEAEIIIDAARLAKHHLKNFGGAPHHALTECARTVINEGVGVCDIHKE